MAANFLPISAEEIEQIPQAMHYLQQAIERTPASTNRLDITMEMAKRGYGEFYLAILADVLVGVAYVMTYNTKDGKVLSPVLLGGKYMNTWDYDWFDFMFKKAQQIGAKPVRFIARKGWKKKYPKLKIIGHIYEFILPE